MNNIEENTRVFLFVRENIHRACLGVPAHGSNPVEGIIIGCRTTEGHNQVTYIQVYNPTRGEMFDVKMGNITQLGDVINLAYLVNKGLLTVEVTPEI